MTTPCASPSTGSRRRRQLPTPTSCRRSSTPCAPTPRWARSSTRWRPCSAAGGKTRLFRFPGAAADEPGDAEADQEDRPDPLQVHVDGGRLIDEKRHADEDEQTAGDECAGVGLVTPLHWSVPEEPWARAGRSGLAARWVPAPP